MKAGVFDGGDRPGFERNVPRFLVVQFGARHGYAVPAALQRQGALALLYTDLVANQGLGKMLATAGFGQNNFAKGLERRNLPTSLLNQCRTFDSAFVFSEGLQRLCPRTVGREMAAQLRNVLMERQMTRAGTVNATHVYTMLGEGSSFVRSAKAAGLGVVGDVYIALSADRIVHEEQARFASWADPIPNAADRDHSRDPNATLLECSDLFICPSEFVRDDLVSNYAVDIRRTVVAPYGVSSPWLTLETNPEPGRVLFAGTANIRKGIHILAGAANILKRSRYRIRVAGHASPRVVQHRDAEELIFLGHLGREAMAQEFRRADVFAFPTLAEGSASVTAEALGAGVPVVTTPAAGSIVRHGVDGLIVPERDPIALAEAVQMIVEDRGLRSRMSSAARIRAADYTWDGFASTVIGATKNMDAKEPRI